MINEKILYQNTQCYTLHLILTLEKKTFTSHLPLKPDAVLKKQRGNKVQTHSQDEVNRLLDILDHMKS